MKKIRLYDSGYNKSLFEYTYDIFSKQKEMINGRFED